MKVPFLDLSVSNVSLRRNLLKRINKILRRETLVVVDDSPAVGNLTRNKDTWQVLKLPPPVIGGKGFLVHEYAEDVGAKVIFSNYQTGWTEFNK